MTQRKRAALTPAQIAAMPRLLREFMRRHYDPDYVLTDEQRLQNYVLAALRAAEIREAKP